MEEERAQIGHLSLAGSRTVGPRCSDCPGVLWLPSGEIAAV